MQRCLMLSLLCGFGGLSSLTNVALAAPVIMNKTEAVAPPRQDSGTGVCGSVIKFTNQATPVNNVEEATMLLNRPMGDPNIIGRVARQFSTLNLSIGVGSEGDLRAPNFSDAILPYSNDANAMPQGSDDNNIAVRIRGYLNVTDTMNGQPVTLGVHCDDGCAVRLGATRQVVMTADERSPVLTGRRARSVVFQDPGLYPIEVVYYQNATSGYLELSRASGMTYASDDEAVSNTEWGQQGAMFRPLGGAELFSAITGVSSECQECETGGPPCAAGTYCGQGICQTCNVAAACGPSCMACTGATSICNAGKCIECMDDAACGAKAVCEKASGTCRPLMACSADNGCSATEVCRPEGYCGAPPTSCTMQTQCDGTQTCSCADGSTTCAQKVCLRPPMTCASSSDCLNGQACDTTAQRCTASYRLTGGGFDACSVNTGSQRSGHGPSLLALLCVAIFGVATARRRSRNGATPSAHK